MSIDSIGQPLPDHLPWSSGPLPRPPAKMDFAQYAAGLNQRRKCRRPGLVVLRSPESTHWLARRIVADYCDEGESPPPMDLVAWEQSAGTGRQKRPWRSPPGQGIYVTMVRTTQVHLAPQLLPLAVALALSGSLRNRGVPCLLKWPNDLYVGSRKLGGILIDRVGETSILSFGINVGGPLANFAEPRATSIEAERGQRPSLDDLATELIAEVEGCLVETPAAEVVADYRARSLHRPGEEMACRVGREVVRGCFLGFDPHGFLRLQVEGVERILAAGELDNDG